MSPSFLNHPFIPSSRYILFTYIHFFTLIEEYEPKAKSCCLMFTVQDGMSSLMFASLNGHVEVVDKLLQQGARVDLQNKVCFISLKRKIYITSPKITLVKG